MVFTFAGGSHRKLADEIGNEVQQKGSSVSADSLKKCKDNNTITFIKQLNKSLPTSRNTEQMLLSII